MSCGICTASIPDEYTLCWDHTAAIQKNLAELDSTIIELRTTMARQDVGTSSLGSGSTTAQPAVNLDALDAYEQLREVVIGWSVALQGRAFYWLVRTEEAGSYLLTNLDLVARQDWAPDLASELADAVRRAVQVTDRAADKISLGRCQTIISGERCPDTVTAIQGQTHGRCRTCGATVDILEYQSQLLADAWHVQAPLPKILRALKQGNHATLPKSRVEWWIKKGTLAPAEGNLYTAAAVMRAYWQTPSGRKVAPKTSADTGRIAS